MSFNDSAVDYCVEFEAVVGVMQSTANKCIGCKFVFGGYFNISRSSDSHLGDILNGFFEVILLVG